MAGLKELENKSIYIIREAYAEFKKPAILWSTGKDSTVSLWNLCAHSRICRLYKDYRQE